jgi:hypothetical protein
MKEDVTQRTLDMFFEKSERRRNKFPSAALIDNMTRDKFFETRRLQASFPAEENPFFQPERR